MSDLMKYNAILPRDDDNYYLWYDSLKGWRLNIRGVGNCSFNEEAEVLFEIQRERIIKLLEDRLRETTLPDGALYVESVVIKQLIRLIKAEK